MAGLHLSYTLAYTTAVVQASASANLRVEQQFAAASR